MFSCFQNSKINKCAFERIFFRGKYIPKWKFSCNFKSMRQGHLASTSQYTNNSIAHLTS